MGNSQKVLGYLLLLLVMSASVMTSGCLRDFERESWLEITNVDISSENIRSNYIDLNVTTEVKSHFADSNNVSLLLKLYDTDTGLLELKRSVFIGTVENGENVLVPMDLTLLKEGGYRIKLYLYEDGDEKGVRQMELSNLDSLRPEIADIGLEFGDVDFIVRDVVDSKVRLQADIYLLNEGSDRSNDYKVLVKAREMDASLLADKTWTSTGSILPDTTKIVSVNLTVPKNYNYIVDVIIWSNDTVVKRGESLVQLSPEKVIEKDTVVQKEVIDAEDFEIFEESEVPYEESGEADMPGFGILVTFVSMLSVVVLYRRKL